MDSDEKIPKIIDHLNIPVVNGREISDHDRWNGENLALSVNDSENLHEIAHWLLATPEQRKYKNYGLGPEGGAHGYFFVKTKKKRDYIECLASLLGIAFEAILYPDDCQQYACTLVEHGWIEPDPHPRWHKNDRVPNATTVKRELRKRGLLTFHTPTVLLEMGFVSEKDARKRYLDLNSIRKNA